MNQLPLLTWRRPARHVAVLIRWPASSHKPLAGRRYVADVVPGRVAEIRRLGFAALGAEVRLRRLDGLRVRVVRASLGAARSRS